MNKFTPKQTQFIEEFLVDFNGTQAAIRAGYSPNTARSQASRMLTNVNVQEALVQRRQEIFDANDLTAEKVIAELVKIAFAQMDAYTSWGPLGVRMVPSNELPEGAAAAVAEVTESITEKSYNLRFKLHDKVGSLDRLLKYLQWEKETSDLDVRIKALEVQFEEQGFKNRGNGTSSKYFTRR
jgi:phage terminase small subunit